jgi:hypothetical protein
VQGAELLGLVGLADGHGLASLSSGVAKTLAQAGFHSRDARVA